MSVLYRNSFPEYLQAVTIGPDPSFMEKNTTNCELVSTFPLEVELMYDWKNAKRSSDPLNALRSFAKKLTVYGPDLDVQTIKFFTRKVRNYPPYYSDQILEEINLSFDIARKIERPYNPTPINKYGVYSFKYGVPIQNDKNFLNKLATMLRICNSPCNYFYPSSDIIGTLADIGRSLVGSTSVGNLSRETTPPPLGIGMNVFNKIAPQIRSEFVKIKIMSENAYKRGVQCFYAATNKQPSGASGASSGASSMPSMGGSIPSIGSAPSVGGLSAPTNISPLGGTSPADISGIRELLTGDTHTARSKSQIFSEVQLLAKSKLGDCYRMYDDSLRYNPYDSTMNLAFSKRKYIGVRNYDVKSLVDITGNNAPGQYVTENTFKRGLDVPKTMESKMYDDSPVRKRYDSYENSSGGRDSAVEVNKNNTNTNTGLTSDGASNANSSVNAGTPPLEGSTGANTQTITAGQQQIGDGLNNIPANGRVLTFGQGELTFTKYGYTGELRGGNPDSGSFIGLGNRGNMIVPLRTVALPPNFVKQYNLKSGDIMIIEITTKSGETFTERRQFGDVSEPKKVFNIDEFLPHGLTSRLVSLKPNSFIAKITIADTKEPLPRYNPAEASNFAAMYLDKNCWDYVLKKNNRRDFAIHLDKMPVEYIKFAKWTGNTV